MVGWCLWVAVALLCSACSAPPAATPIVIYVTPAPTASPTPTAEPTPAPTPTIDPSADIAHARKNVQKFADYLGLMGAPSWDAFAGIWFATNATYLDAAVSLGNSELAWARTSKLPPHERHAYMLACSSVASLELYANKDAGKVEIEDAMGMTLFLSAATSNVQTALIELR
jgi:hypothetical protein